MLEDLLSRFIPDSEVSELGPNWARVSADTASVLRATRRLHTATDGYFDPLLGAHMRYWEAVAARTPTSMPASSAPSPPTIVEAVDGHFRLHGAPAGSVDLGGIAKGYTADELRDALVKMGQKDVMVSFGGSSIAMAGAPPPTTHPPANTQVRLP